MRSRRIIAFVGAWLALEAIAYFAESRLALALAPLPLLGVIVVLGLRRRAFDPIEPIWLTSAVFLFTYGAVASLQLYRPGPFASLPGYFSLSPPHYLRASLIGGAALLAFLAAYESRFGEALARVLARRDLQPSRRRLVLVTVGLLAVGIVVVEAALLRADVFAFSVAEIRAGRLREVVLASAHGHGYFLVGFVLLQFGLASVVYLAATTMDPSWQRRVPIVALGCALVAGIVFAGLLGSREYTVICLVQIVVVLHLFWRRVSPRLAGLAVLGLGTFGVSLFSLRTTGGLTVDPIVLAGFASKTFDGFNFLTTAIARVDQPQVMRTLAEDIGWTYLPRAVFEDKPTVYGIVAAQRSVVGTVAATGTYPPGIVAEGWVNLGLAGALLLPAATGVLLRTAYGYATRTRSMLGVLFFGYLFGSQTGIARGLGPILASLLFLGALLACLVMASKFLVRHYRAALTATAIGTVCAMVSIPALISPLAPSKTLAEGRLPADIAPLPPLVRTDRPTAQSDRPVLVLFWSTWCSRCARQLEHVGSLPREAAAVVSIVYQDDVSAARRLQRELDVPGKLIHDSGGLTVARFKVDQLPTTYVLSARQRPLCAFRDVTAADTLRATLRSVRRHGRC